MPRSLQPLREKGSVGTALCFHLPRLEQGCFGSLGTCPLTLCTDVYMLVFCAEVCGPRARCQGQSREQLSWSKPPCFPFPSIPHFVPAPSPAASPSPCRVRAKCPRCHHAHVLDCGCRTPSRSPTKLLLLGTEQGWGGQAGMCPPEYQ